MSVFYPLLVAITFLTRVPLPLKRAPTSTERARSVMWYPLVGAGVGASIAAVALLLTSAGLPRAPAVLVAIACGLLVTGAFHEDGLADTADGLGGGWTPEQALSITKASARTAPRRCSWRSRCARRS
jgi:adenosylcobinamide-GDP ribazoletransferase